MQRGISPIQRYVTITLKKRNVPQKCRICLLKNGFGAENFAVFCRLSIFVYICRRKGDLFRDFSLGGLKNERFGQGPKCLYLAGN